MIVQPDFVTQAMVAEARQQFQERKAPPALSRLRFERFAEARAAQILHIGPYEAEGPTIATLHQFIADQGRRLRGKHHEIYLGDPRRTKPERLKTVLRQPVA